MHSQQTNSQIPTQESFIKLSEVTKRTALSRSAIYALIKSGSFPKQIKLGERASAWVESEVNQWIQNRINENRPGTA